MVIFTVSAQHGALNNGQVGGVSEKWMVFPTTTLSSESCLSVCINLGRLWHFFPKCSDPVAQTTTNHKGPDKPRNDFGNSSKCWRDSHLQHYSSPTFRKIYWPGKICFYLTVDFYGISIIFFFIHLTGSSRNIPWAEIQWAGPWSDDETVSRWTGSPDWGHYCQKWKAWNTIQLYEPCIHREQCNSLELNCQKYVEVDKIQTGELSRRSTLFSWDSTRGFK